MDVMKNLYNIEADNRLSICAQNWGINVLRKYQLWGGDVNKLEQALCEYIEISNKTGIGGDWGKVIREAKLLGVTNSDLFGK